MLVIVSIVVAALMIDTSISKIYVFSTTTTQSLLSLRMSNIFSHRGYLRIRAVLCFGFYQEQKYGNQNQETTLP